MPHSDTNLTLTSVYSRPDRAIILWELLKERDASVNISHKQMPTWDEHVRFVESKPYEAWYFIQDGTRIVGSCYLSKRNEIGIQVFKAHQGKGYATASLQRLMKRHGTINYLANVNPANSRSAALFQKLGFNLVQHTYEMEAPFKS